jgi:hypothetical protein
MGYDPFLIFLEALLTEASGFQVLISTGFTHHEWGNSTEVYENLARQLYKENPAKLENTLARACAISEATQAERGHRSRKPKGSAATQPGNAPVLAVIPSDYEESDDSGVDQFADSDAESS